MKKAIIILIAIGLFSFTGEKEYSFKMHEGEVVMLYNTLQYSKQVLLKSTAPFSEVVQAVQNIDSLTKVIVTQYQLQLPKDTTKKK